MPRARDDDDHFSFLDIQDKNRCIVSRSLLAKLENYSFFFDQQREIKLGNNIMKESDYHSDFAFSQILINFLLVLS